MTFLGTAGGRFTFCPYPSLDQTAGNPPFASHPLCCQCSVAFFSFCVSVTKEVRGCYLIRGPTKCVFREVSSKRKGELTLVVWPVQTSLARVDEPEMMASHSDWWNLGSPPPSIKSRAAVPDRENNNDQPVGHDLVQMIWRRVLGFHR